MSQTEQLTQEYLQSRLDYYPDTGIFIWKYSDEMPKKWNTKWAGKVAGTKAKYRNGYYINICINNKRYGAHRIAFLYVYGWLPEQVDHIDNNGPKTDNRICNLRAATHGQNLQNRGAQKNNTSGYKGVRIHRKTGRYHAQITVEGKVISLKYHDTPEEAAEAYAEASQRYHGKYGRIK